MANRDVPTLRKKVFTINVRISDIFLKSVFPKINDRFSSRFLKDIRLSSYNLLE